MRTQNLNSISTVYFESYNYIFFIEKQNVGAFPKIYFMNLFFIGEWTLTVPGNILYIWTSEIPFISNIAYKLCKMKI